jgi:hypothetical protein
MVSGVWRSISPTSDRFEGPSDLLFLDLLMKVSDSSDPEDEKKPSDFFDVKSRLSDVSTIAKTGVLFVFHSLWSIPIMICHPKAVKSDFIFPT